MNLRRLLGSRLQLMTLLLVPLPALLYIATDPGWMQWIYNIRFTTARGFVRKVYIDSTGRSWPYSLFVPFDYQPGEQPPVLLFLNGLGDNGNDGSSHLNGPFGIALWERKAKFPFLAVMPQCRRTFTWAANGEDAQRALEILDQVIKDYGADSDRVYATGASTGGQAVWDLAVMHPKRFAAIAPICGRGIPPVSATELANAQVPVWNFLISADAQNLVRTNRASHYSLLRAGSSPRYTELYADASKYPRWDLHAAWEFAYRTPALFEWLLTNSHRKNALEQPPFVLLLNGHDLAGWTSDTIANWSVDPDTETYHNTPSGSAPNRIETAAAYHNFEFHVDVKFETNRRFGIRFRASTKDLNDGLKFEICDAVQGSGGLRDVGRQKWIAPCDPIAQRMLDPESWNDVRLTVVDSHIQASLNGFTLFELTDSELTTQPGPIGFEIPPDTTIQLRYPRIRSLNDGANP